MSWLISADIWRQREKIRQASEDDLMRCSLFRACVPSDWQQVIASSIARKVPYLLIFTILAC